MLHAVLHAHKNSGALRHQQRKAPDRPLEVISVTMSPSENLLVTGSGDSIAGIWSYKLTA